MYCSPFSFSSSYSSHCSQNGSLHFLGLVQRCFPYLDRKCSVHPTALNQKVLVVSDEDELLVLIEAYRNPHPRQQVHRPYHLVATQFDLDTDLEAQRVFKGLFVRKLDGDTIWPCAACCLPPRSRVSAHTFPSLPLAGRPPCYSLPVSILLLKSRNDRGNTVCQLAETRAPFCLCCCSDSQNFLPTREPVLGEPFLAHPPAARPSLDSEGHRLSATDAVDGIDY